MDKSKMKEIRRRVRAAGHLVQSWNQLYSLLAPTGTTIGRWKELGDEIAKLKEIDKRTSDRVRATYTINNNK